MWYNDVEVKNWRLWMIKITKIKINNFRSFKNSDNLIENFDKLNILTGRNNVGKTNVLRAINLFFNPEVYNSAIDRNAIKQITQGASKEPVITVDFIDDELDKGKESKYQIYLNLNNENHYKTNSKNPKLNTSSKIKSYLDKKFKCVYLSTTDQVLSNQAYDLINDMILQYFKKKHKAIKDTVEQFEKQYNTLLDTFKGQISDIESDLNNEFRLFRENNINISPKLTIREKTNISEFLLSNISLQLDDDYAQIIDAKGAGVQRTSVVLLTFFLLNEIFQYQNKIILLDEPEAFLYPLLTTGLKNSILEMTDQDSCQTQVFITTHSREFLKEVNNPLYKFYNISQKKENQSFARSKNEVDVVKYSVVNAFDGKKKNEVLKNYGLLDEVDDHEQIIICEGPTDKNYIEAILNSKSSRPQIRYNRYLNDSSDLPYDFIGKGAESIIPILVYLDKVSHIDRKIYILLDGDETGKKIESKLKKDKNKFKNFEIMIHRIDDKKEIEDMIFSKEYYIERIIEICPEIADSSKEFKSFFERHFRDKNYIDLTKEFIAYHKLSVKEDQIKHMLSTNLQVDRINTDWILSKLENFFDLN